MQIDTDIINISRVKLVPFPHKIGGTYDGYHLNVFALGIEIC